MPRHPGSDSGVTFPRSTLLDRAAYANRESAFHVTITAHAKIGEFPEAAREAIWEHVVEQVSDGRVRMIAACLMPDHVHLLVYPASQDLHSFVQAWKSFTTHRAWSVGHKGSLWQPKMWDRTIRGDADLRRTIRYIVENPARAGLVMNWEEWQWTLLPSDPAGDLT